MESIPYLLKHWRRRLGKKHRADNVAGGDQIFDGVATTSVDEGQGVWYNEITDEWELVEDGTAPFVMWGVALDDAGAGKQFSILFSGVDSFVSPSNFSAGVAIYIDSSTSGLTTTATGNQQIGHALTDGATGDDFLLHVDNPGVGITGGVEETLASNTEAYFNNISTTSIEIPFTGSIIGIEVMNDHATNNVAIRFDTTDAAIPSAGSSLSPNNIIRPKESRFFAVAATVCNIIASAASTPVRVTGWLA